MPLEACSGGQWRQEEVDFMHQVCRAVACKEVFSSLENVHENIKTGLDRLVPEGRGHSPQV